MARLFWSVYGRRGPVLYIVSFAESVTVLTLSRVGPNRLISPSEHVNLYNKQMRQPRNFKDILKTTLAVRISSFTSIYTSNQDFLLLCYQDFLLLCYLSEQVLLI